MRIKKIIKYYFNGIRELYRIQKEIANSSCKLDHVATELIRNTHSIEKGLSLKEQKMSFGLDKQKQMKKYIDLLEDSPVGFHQEARQMAADCLRQYADLHPSMEHVDTHKPAKKMDNSDKTLEPNIQTYGGIQRLERQTMHFDVEEIEKFFHTRHSVRDFSSVPIEQDDIIKAIQLAQTAPSACNRQGYRAYVISGNQREKMAQWLQGVGGVQNTDGVTYILITSKLSAYTLYETSQHAVTASVFAAYLSLSLHLYGFGACICQRQITWSPTWEKLKEAWNVGEDEHPICVVCAGNLNDACNVPISHRMDYHEVLKFVQ